MTATTLSHGASFGVAANGKDASKRAPKTSGSFLGRLVAAFWLWTDAMSEARALAREAHERLPFAEW